jgi:hypothetical protein
MAPTICYWGADTVSLIIFIISWSDISFILVENYSERFGDCNGHDIKKITKTKLPQCEEACNSDDKCLTFLFVDLGADSYCWIKNYKCPTLSATNHLNYHFYNKSKCTPTPAGPVRWRYWPPKDGHGIQFYVIYIRVQCPEIKCTGASFLGQQ